MYRQIPDPAPETAEVVGNLKIDRYESETGRVLVKIWRGKQSRPYAHYAFRDANHREEYIREQIESAERLEKFKAERRAERKTEAAAMRKSIKVGTVLHYSWGYDQTQCEFYQVVDRSKSGASVTVRRIAGEQTDAKTGYDSCMMIPRPDAFLSNYEPIRKVVGPNGLSMDCGLATPVEPGKSYYCSWYA